MILVYWTYKVLLKRCFDVDIPNLQSIISSGSSFYNPRSIILKSILMESIFILDIANDVIAENFEFRLDNSFRKVTTKSIYSNFYGWVIKVGIPKALEDYINSIPGAGL